MRIDPCLSVLQGLPRVAPLPVPGSAPVALSGGTPGPFLSRLADAVREVNELQLAAGTQAQRPATGQAQDVQEVVLAMERADLALRLTIQVTEKAVEAYREISQMQV
jgi:flagellar hook-basal body complex protein FliE